MKRWYSLDSVNFLRPCRNKESIIIRWASTMTSFYCLCYVPCHTDTSLLSHMFRNLAPITQYLVTVRAENGVSYLHKRVEERMEQLEITTAEGSMFIL